MKVKYLRIADEETFKKCNDDESIDMITDRGIDITASVITKAIDKWKAIKDILLIKGKSDETNRIENTIHILQQELKAINTKAMKDILPKVQEVITQTKDFLKGTSKKSKDYPKPTKTKPLPKSFDLEDLIDS